jgi:hypothetical protein
VFIFRQLKKIEREERILKHTLYSFAMPALVLFQLVAATGCESMSQSESSATGQPRYSSPAPGVSGVSGPAEGCAGGASDRLCIGLKYVAYTDSAGNAAATQAQAAQLTREMNQVWSACGIAFQLEVFQAVNPSDAGLTYNTGGFGEQDDIRAAFGDDRRFLIVATGPWNRGGGAVAWTQAPGAGAYGVVADHSVATDTNVMAHELGHYLSLDHVSDDSNLLSPVVYASSSGLSQSQCAAARDSATGFWTHMLR